MEGRIMRREMFNLNRRVGNWRNKNNSLDRMQALIKFDLSYFTLLFFLILVIISDQGGSEQKSTNASARQRWLQYQTALSNTGPLGSSSDGSSTAVSSETDTNISTVSGSSSIPNISASGGGGGTFSATAKNANNNNNNRNKNNNNNNNNSNNNGRKRIDPQQRFSDGALFENNTSVNLTVPLGDTAFLRCRVRNLGERSISWVRSRDYHILTTGKTTYTNDERFHVLHTEGTDDWTLQIKFVQRRDNGTYECQISTGTGIISFMVNLLIAVPEAFILGNGDEYHVEQGSMINLTCVIERSPKVPEFIFWYHNDKMINYGSEVTVRTDPSGARTQSRLTIRNAVISDTGNYSCHTPPEAVASIFVYVSQASGLFSGDNIAAIQRRKSSTSSASSHHLQIPLLLVHWLATKTMGLSMSQTFPIFLSISQSLGLSSSTTTGLSFPSTSREFGLVFFILGTILIGQQALFV